MKHATAAALDRIESILKELRRFDQIHEKKRGVFYRKSSAFVHFHEDPAGMFADVRGDNDWVRVRVNTVSDRRKLMRLVAKILRAK